MAAAFVAERAKARATAGNPTQAVSGTTNGNLLVISFAIASMAVGTGSLTSVSDTGGNTWNVVANGQTATTTTPGIFIAYSFLTAAPGTITMTTSGSFGNGISWKVEEFSGLAAFDTASTAKQNPAATSLTTNAATPAGAGELAIVASANQVAQSTVTAGSGYTLAGTVLNTSPPEPILEYNLSAGSGSQTATLSWGTSGKSAGQLAFFTISGGITDHNLSSCGCGH